jgi:tetratricopeptide (TPR) repeat protein
MHSSVTPLRRQGPASGFLLILVAALLAAGSAIAVAAAQPAVAVDNIGNAGNAGDAGREGLAGRGDDVDPEAGPTVGASWNALWQNDASSARAGFLAALEEDDRNADALRGLVVAEMMLALERDALEHLVGLSECETAGFRDLLLARYYYRTIATHGEDEKTFMKICKKLSEKKALDPIDRRPVLADMAVYALSAGKRGDVEDAAKELNRIETVSVLGPFSNISGGGHEKDFLEFPAKPLVESYEGWAGVKLSWHTPPRLSLSRTVNFEQQLGRSELSTCYAGFQLTVDEPRDLLLSVTQTGALIVQVDDAVALDVSRPQTQKETNHLLVHFERGVHALVFKCSGREEGTSVAVALSETDGERPGDVEIRPLWPFQSTISKATARRIRLPGLEALEREYASAPDGGDPAAAFWYLLGQWTCGEREQARQASVEAAESYSRCAVIQHLTAIMALESEEKDTYRQRMKRLCELMPGSRFCVMFTVIDLREQNAHTRADSVAAAAVERNPQFVSAELELMESLINRDRIPQAAERAQHIVERYPRFGAPYLVLSNHAELTGDQRSAGKWKREAYDRLPKDSSLLQRWLDAAGREDWGEVVDRLEEMLELFPDSPWVLSSYVAATIYNGDANKAIELSRRLAEDFPGVADAQLLQAAIEELRIPEGDRHKELAIEYYRRGLALEPGNFDARDKLRELAGKKPISEILPPIELGDYRERRVDADDYPGASAVVVLDESRRVRFRDGTNYTDHAMSVKILNAEGVDKFSTVSTEINPIYSDYDVKAMRTVKPDGREIEGELIYNTVAFKSLAPGDIVELHYGASTWSAHDLNQQFWDSHLFQWNVPCLLSRYTLLVSSGTEFDWQLNNYEGDAEQVVTHTRAGEFDRYTWEMTDVPAVGDEPLLPPWRDNVPWLDVSSVESWQQINDWYYKLSSAPSRPDPVVANRVAKITAGIDDRDEKIRALYDFVCNEVVYEDALFRYSAYVPELARNVLRSMYGDCKDKVCLLRSMLEEIGVHSHFVLVTPLDDGCLAYLPSPRFNHTILAIPAGEPADQGAAVSAGRYRFIDPTARYMPAGSLPSSLEGAEGLLIQDGEAERVVVSSGAGKQSRRHGFIDTRMTLAGEDDIEVERRERIYKGTNIAITRVLLADKSEDEQKKLINQLLNLQLSRAEITRCEFQGLETTADSVVIDYAFTLRGGVTEQGDLKVLRFPWDSALISLFGMLVAGTTREEPLYTYGLDVEEYESVTFEIPDGWGLLSVPEPKSLRNAYGWYEYAYEVEGGRLRADRRVTIARALVPPEEYGMFKELVEGAMKEQETVVILERK